MDEINVFSDTLWETRDPLIKEINDMVSKSTSEVCGISGVERYFKSDNVGRQNSLLSEATTFTLLLIFLNWRNDNIFNAGIATKIGVSLLTYMTTISLVFAAIFESSLKAIMCALLRSISIFYDMPSGDGSLVSKAEHFFIAGALTIYTGTEILIQAHRMERILIE